ncbi:LacI family DNA-binding transcriptional regulator [Rouxiella badensis]|jgi:LacI family transcriptional regulator|uniref:LacI family DNA-binding transcriptional regulator n=1 Tax=Rouxiella badensis TaxID=1646377 RepID=UPI00038162AF|nr:LacI family DNA-binding transcriptional regulator [Rouxiella badensis]MCC3718300.1 LacI family transcriptional regulator [Rouxiella badensis]MCC3726932.1 LacI family transcriptional regulator [Rouxiella badensis]MCC3738719.1 LacI family transcriptional regulator [Rouxiella badensis]MCC3746714.1 LacI family transcriptional regulator [Rouxiella badensis]QII37795.1 LacI family transcriptional regulator [Rouxiella badensis]
MTIGNARIKAPTVADVAREAQVSKAQAARALGGYGSVSEEVLTRVRAAAQRLSYRPNELARSMNTGRSNTLGVIVGDIENPHFGLALRGISDVARQAGYHLLLSNSDETLAVEQDAVRVMLEKQVDGIIIAPCSSLPEDNAHLAQILADGRALKLFDRAVPELNVEVIGLDFTSTAQQATLSLLDAGHRRISYLTSMTFEPPYSPTKGLGVTPVAQRVAGIERAFSQRGLSVDPASIVGNASSDQAIAAIVERLFNAPQPPTAIIASDSVIAMSLLRELGGRGLRVPQDLSFVMFDNFPWTEIVSPPLSVIAQPVYEMGREAARRIICDLRGEEAGIMPDFEATFMPRFSIAPV